MSKKDREKDGVPPRTMEGMWEHVVELKVAMAFMAERIEALFADLYRTEAEFMRREESRLRHIGQALDTAASEGISNEQIGEIAQTLHQEEARSAQRRAHYEEMASVHTKALSERAT